MCSADGHNTAAIEFSHMREKKKRKKEKKGKKIIKIKRKAITPYNGDVSGGQTNEAI